MNPQAQTCPCCDNSLLRHIRHGKIYWFCSHCRQEAPVLAIASTVIATNNISEAIALQPPIQAKA